MSSLRTRVLASVLALAAAGMLILAAVIYAEQRSFLQGRLDQEVRAAGPAVSQALDNAGFAPNAAARSGVAAHSAPPGEPNATSGPPKGIPPGGPGPGHGRGRGGPNLNLPPGTFGQRRSASGAVVGHVLISFGQAAPPKPVIPKQVPIGKLFTVGSSGSSGLRYRAYVIHDPEDSGLTLIAVPLREVDQTLSRLLLVEGLVIAGVLLALGASAFFVVKLGLRPLDRIAVTASEIAAGELDRRVSPATSRTEIGRLGLALNAMLERLEHAFAARTESEERLRSFLADASHELRTPLASIRGYAELFRMGAAAEPEQTATAMRRIEDEAERMGVLVEDLLALARLDEAPERERQIVELVQLARDAVQDATATAPERVISLDARKPVELLADPLQLQQVLANLLRNALMHTPPGTPIDVAVGERCGTVTLSVRDHGLGVPAASRVRLFERFWRAEAGRERGRAGAGLGLAIASAIVEAHHGQISVHDAPGGGALFLVEIPAAAPELLAAQPT
jgi:two-component system, OmpR family, sensor kinase